VKILLYSSVFPPSIGGVESIAVTLATKIVQQGHDCVVVTETPSTNDDSFYPFAVHRRPSKRGRFRLVRESSLVHANGASVAMYPYARLARKPFMWTHNGYQALCIDGLGWAYGESAPMSPWQSIVHHGRRRGYVYACREAAKLWLRRRIACRVDLNVACTDWVAQRLGLPRQVVAYTPYPLEHFRSAATLGSVEFEFIYVGRLVSEKGVDDLISAMALHCSNPEFGDSTLAIVGDGPQRERLERQTSELGIQRNVAFLGAKRGRELREAMMRGRVGIVPSRWEEPMGGVSLELLASGRKLIVSQRGGHAECVRGVALTFPNGDVDALRECMDRMKSEANIQFDVNLAHDILRRFDENLLAAKYIELYTSLAKQPATAIRDIETKEQCQPAS
jgi:glycosyltransferase involved in cell wall biosynthesis